MDRNLHRLRLHLEWVEAPEAGEVPLVECLRILYSVVAAAGEEELHEELLGGVVVFLKELLVNEQASRPRSCFHLDSNHGHGLSMHLCE